MKSTDEFRSGKGELGRKGEMIARDFLVRNGYRILDQNWRIHRKELDIVAQIGNEIIVVEVKTRHENISAEPYESVTYHKIKNIVEVAEHWLKYHQSDLDCRFDVISIIVKKDGSHSLEHFKAAFTAPLN